ncbi:MAG: NADH:flavin oxidoreductase/NADH oxidase family protein [Oleiphilaceae bacterium]|nr:NADH:flavin oxidoreductase/NADH oxidase family protein [Oleiphilaceae bacterium]
MTETIYSSLILPCGQVIRNRIAKAAMEENMADADGNPSKQLLGLYKQWSLGGTGLLITGNVMVDGHAMTGPGGVVLDANAPLKPFKQWAHIAQLNDTKAWMQINHPGRQVFSALKGKALSPSDIQVDLGKRSNMIAKPKALTEAEIHDIIQRFALTASRAEETGFSGVQIHAAHGYLISQFLSPISNKRQDQWGGSIENRSRMLLETVRAVRAAVSDQFAVSVKLNSADFQRGGFSEDDARYVIEQLNNEKIDLVELSGGSYESPAMQGRTADGRTLAREAYFLEFAEELKQVAQMPLMTTGGIKRKPVAESVLEAGIDMIGIATGLALEPRLPDIWKTDPNKTVSMPEPNFSDKAISALATMAIVRRQLQRLGKGKAPKADVSPLFTLIKDRVRFARMTKRYNARISA